ncbi:MAG TPA: glutamate--tRNA ligase, partial [Buchnera sp. (in: enterobacteria)]|nr:glutamate--tRNA ligase [Buchnera sp. (in: enterobacteria)]
NRLDTLRKNQILMGLKPRYDGKCRNLRKEHIIDKVYVIRFRNPRTGKVVFNDHIRGKIVFNNTELDDLIILRSNKVPTYNFCVVIDDRDMQITHVIRGEDHINNTPRQINILHALGAKIPQYAHVSMIVDNFGKKLSKRNNIVDIMEYYKMGYLPEAILNYIVRLGWSYGNQEIFSVNEMKKKFTLEGINKSSSIFDTKKLLWLNHHYINTLPVDYISKCLKYYFSKQNIDINHGPMLTDVINILGHRCKTLQEIVQLSRYFYEEFHCADNAIIKKYLNMSHLVILEKMSNKISLLSLWNVEKLSQSVKQLSCELNVPFKEIGMPLRVAIIGSMISPSIAITMYFIGKTRLLHRIKKAIKYIKLNFIK